MEAQAQFISELGYAQSEMGLGLAISADFIKETWFRLSFNFYFKILIWLEKKLNV